MNKIEALDYFWNSFGLIAYDATSVPDNAQLPYITYEASFDGFGSAIAQTANLWYRGTSWKPISLKELEIAKAIGRGGMMVSYDEGAFWIRKGTPWAQRLTSENDDTIRRIVLNVEIEFID